MPTMREIAQAARTAAVPRRPRVPAVRAALAATLALLVLAPGCGEGGRGKGQDDLLIDLDRAFQPLRRDFEGEAGKVRLIGVVAPTCGRCVESAEAVAGPFLSGPGSEGVEVLLVWSGLMPTDVRLRARAQAEKLVDPRLRHYWEESGRFARIFGQLVGAAPGTAIYDVYFLYGPGDTWDPEGTMEDEPPDQNALVAGWMPPPAAFVMGDQRHGSFHGFDLNRLAEEIDRLRDPAVR